MVLDPKEFETTIYRNHSFYGRKRNKTVSDPDEVCLTQIGFEIDKYVGF